MAIYGRNSGDPSAAAKSSKRTSTIIMPLSPYLSFFASVSTVVVIFLYLKTLYFMLTFTACLREKHLKHLVLITEHHKVPGISYPCWGSEKGPVFFTRLMPEDIMNAVVHIVLLISAMIVFTFERADIANRPDYAEEDSVF
ncbi:TPA: hypothetical protein ACF632_005072 [Salmonella enterica]